MYGFFCIRGMKKNGGFQIIGEKTVQDSERCTFDGDYFYLAKVSGK
jgi:hypothetical protein